ncbi:hypothetical protein BO78DRAFT_428253 [Aspergillus sclerotiicarbonarius CBS 121057]|uniref:Uncharacterized protein n=1 Tax=Aspergillus sclerotiicarbonarius (strain CBS 121057 / IBT 28362) TaxID=1448318 RepID=A0A319ENS0_ASPSB|nr:hypothetical protein BO78DRAFT_428253 [Aspergillus sclerotiicarbonarius CBS 121057]
MFGKPREITPCEYTAEPVRALHPLPVVQWGPLALAQLGVPIVIGELVESGFRPISPKRIPRPEILEDLPNPEEVIEKFNAGYRRLDQSTKTFEYPAHLPERTERVVLIPNSFSHLKLQTRPLVESFVKAALDDESIDENGFLDITSWGDMLRSWLSMMAGYLGIENDILDDCDDERAVAWYSKNFGRVREETYGPLDRRISKRLGSGKEFAYDRRGVPLE